MIDQLQKLQQTLKLVTNFAERYPHELVTVKPDAVAFSANEIIYHLLEVEELWQRRIHQLLHSDDKNFQQIDPDALAKEHKYNEQSYEEGIKEWKDSREDTIDLINAMTDEERHIIGIHSRYGEMDTFQILDIMADHDLQHLRQMERTLKQIQN
jgi:uncharacterized damage-inducible protein DinB